MKHGRWTALLWVTIGLGLTGLLLVSTRIDSDGGRYAGPMPKPELPPLPVMVGGRIQFRGSTGLDTSQEPTSAQPDAVRDTTAAETNPYVTRVTGAKEFTRLPVTDLSEIVNLVEVVPRRRQPAEPDTITWEVLGVSPPWQPEGGTNYYLGSGQVERKGGIFEAVKTVPGVSGW